MRIKKINGNSYTLKLNKTFYNAKKQYSTTEGFLVELITNSKIGYGEASPLKGFSRETIQEIQWTFQAFIESINLNRVFISKIISQPIAKYNNREINSYLPVKNNFFIVPMIDKISTVINIPIPE